MALKIKPKFNKAQLAQLVGQKLQRFNDAVFLRFSRIGEEFVTNARNNHTYTDRTGNLTSSIGYVILKDGTQLSENFFEKAGPALGDQQLIGREKARQVIDELSQKFPTGYVLICVAGMEYAASVEAKGFDVITASAITAKGGIVKQLDELISKVT